MKKILQATLLLPLFLLVGCGENPSSASTPALSTSQEKSAIEVAHEQILSVDYSLVTKTLLTSTAKNSEDYLVKEESEEKFIEGNSGMKIATTKALKEEFDPVDQYYIKTVNTIVDNPVAKDFFNLDLSRFVFPTSCYSGVEVNGLTTIFKVIPGSGVELGTDKVLKSYKAVFSIDKQLSELAFSYTTNGLNIDYKITISR